MGWSARVSPLFTCTLVRAPGFDLLARENQGQEAG